MSRFASFLISLALIALTLLLGVPVSAALTGRISGVPIVIALLLGVGLFAWLSLGPSNRKRPSRRDSLSPEARRQQSERRSVTFLVLVSVTVVTGLHFLIVYGIIATSPNIYNDIVLAYPAVFIGGHASGWATMLSTLSLA